LYDYVLEFLSQKNIICETNVRKNFCLCFFKKKKKKNFVAKKFEMIKSPKLLLKRDKNGKICFLILFKDLMPFSWRTLSEL
jgi:hypothetical protein